MTVRSELKDAIMEGDVLFKRVHGVYGYDYMELDTRFNILFSKAMADISTIVVKKILESYKGFEGINTLVDVGGGLVVTLSLITSKYPHIQGINFDLPPVIKHAPSYPGIYDDDEDDDIFNNTYCLSLKFLHLRF